MTQAMAATNTFFNDPAEYARYRDREMIRRDRISEQEGLLKKGIEKGLEKGLEKGWEKAINKVVSQTSVAEAARVFEMSETKIREIVARVGIDAS